MNRSRPWWTKLLWGLLPAVALAVGLELALRIANYHGAAADPYASFVQHRPLFLSEGNRRTTDPARLRLFHDQQFEDPKPEGRLRLFVFGGSATYGFGLPDPTAQAYPGLLQRQLAENLEQPVEVINVGGIQYASYRLLGLVQECLAYQPNAVVVMTGNNEFLEARSYAELKSRGATRSLWRRSRLLQAAAQIGDRLRARQTATESGQAVLNPLTIDERYVVRDEAERQATLDHFHWNLEQMVARCREAGVPIILCTVPTNLRDWPPFHSEGSGKLPEDFINARLADVEQQLAARDHAAALAAADDLLTVEPGMAMLHFARAKALDGLGQTAEARVAYVQARDLDGFPHRATTPFNETVREVAQEAGVPCLDSEALFAAAARDGLPGRDLFLDQCHPNRKGHQLLAEALAPLATTALPTADPPPAP